MILEIKEKFYPLSKCATRVSGVRVDKKQDPNAFKDFWKEYVDHVVIVEMENRCDTYNNPKEIITKEKLQRWGTIQIVKAFLGIPIIQWTML